MMDATRGKVLATARRVLKSVCLVGVIGLAACGLPAQIEQELPSPDGRYLATVTSVDGGALNSTTYSVVLRHVGEDFPRFGGRVFRSTRGLPVIAWKDSEGLRIRCRCRPEWIEVNKGQWNEVPIVAELLPIPDQARLN